MSSASAVYLNELQFAQWQKNSDSKDLNHVIITL